MLAHRAQISVTRDPFASTVSLVGNVPGTPDTISLFF